MSLRPVDLIPPDEENDGPDQAWQDYCATAKEIRPQSILDAVLCSLDADDSPLYPFIEDALANPHEPGRARDSLTKLASLGQALLDRIAVAVDDQVNLRMAIRR